MPNLETQQLDSIISSRRNMIALGGAALASLAFVSVAKAQTTTLMDADYLNFALNLEYLEAQFYTLATVGATIDMLGVGIASGASTPAAGGTVTVKNANSYTSCKVPFTNALVSSYATETASEERRHVSFLRNALGSAAVAQPNIDLYNSFNGLAALLSLGLTSFDPFASDINFLLGAYIFEDVGVTAYAGAAPALTMAANLDAAAGIEAVEAYHAGLIRTTIYGLDQAATTLGPAGTASAVATAISKLRATVDGSASITATNSEGDDIGLGTQQVMLEGTTNLAASTLVNASTTGSLNPAGSTGTAGSLAFTRTAAQVLSIVYAGGAAGVGGGFFPNGLNGNVK
jgi:Ferritin-like domain